MNGLNFHDEMVRNMTSPTKDAEDLLLQAYNLGRAEIKADIAQECHYLLNSGMGKKKSLEHLIRILERKEGIG